MGLTLRMCTGIFILTLLYTAFMFLPSHHPVIPSPANSQKDSIFPTLPRSFSPRFFYDSNSQWQLFKVSQNFKYFLVVVSKCPCFIWIIATSLIELCCLFTTVQTVSSVHKHLWDAEFDFCCCLGSWLWPSCRREWVRAWTRTCLDLQFICV